LEETQRDVVDTIKKDNGTMHYGPNNTTKTNFFYRELRPFVSKGQENLHWQIQKTLVWTISDSILPPQQQRIIYGGQV
jgi:hypothetical protein